ncbi:hypothetical protein RSAG8_05166, partial [Rhizoctonia solani AG-8 WAC10335]
MWHISRHLLSLSPTYTRRTARAPSSMRGIEVYVNTISLKPPLSCIVKK